ncbi:hypothetical protein Droror1_Dr00013885 [Drosera rotundifolia]
MAEVAAAAKSVKTKKGSGVIKRVMGKLEASLRGARCGYFVVIAAAGDEPRKFVVGLDLLNDPEFLVLLKQAEEEFGFKHEGALALPCQPEELQRIIWKRKNLHGC